MKAQALLQRKGFAKANIATTSTFQIKKPQKR